MTGALSLAVDPPELDAVQAEIRACRRCVDAGYLARAHPVFRGRVGHRLMIVGQAPGARGHQSAVPYAGASGRTLRSWLELAGFAPDDLTERFYLTSVTKCFPGPSATGKGDRAPSRAEVTLCAAHLDREIALVKPELILSLGRLSIETLRIGKGSLSELVGTIRRGERAGHAFLALPLPHPSGVSHWLNAPENRERVRAAMAILADLRRQHDW
jgi:uracil-DNA glycosylase